MRGGEMFKRSHRSDPDHFTLTPRWFRWFTRQLADGGKNEAVAALVDIALALHPQSPAVHKSAGDYYLQTGRKKQALKHYQKSISLEMNLQRIKEIIETVETQEHPKKDKGKK
jgi:tetratricopeptide (TPR) repeat protein